MQTKNILRNALLVCGLAASSSFAATITLASSAAETANSTSSATRNIPANPLWANAFAGTNWVSYTQSGNPSSPGFTVVPNGTNVTFTDTFTITGTPNFGTLIFMADDTTNVVFNGTTLTNFAPLSGNTYAVCSDYAPGCLAGTAASASLTPYLHSGVNTLSFTVQQINGTSFGLDYSGIVTSSSATPEPGTLALFGLPLAALGFLRKKKEA